MRLLTTLAAVIGLTVVLMGCTKVPDDATLKAKGTDQGSATEASCDFTAVLSDEEIAGLMTMREEEKVARDVYLTFSGLYPDVPIFDNIAKSEQRHMDAILKMITGYGLTDPVPAADFGIGEFTPAFQSVYDDLVAKGTTLLKAYEVGVEIEEMDIEDIAEWIAVTEAQNILQVYEHLLAGSENHLKAFSSKL